MAVHIETHEDLHTIVIALVAPLNWQKDYAEGIAASGAFKKACGCFIYRILDLSQSRLTFSDMMVGMSVGKGAEGGLYDPEVATVLVGTGELVQMGFEAGKNHLHYQDVNLVGLVATREEAWDLIRKLSEEASSSDKDA